MEIGDYIVITRRCNTYGGYRVGVDALVTAVYQNRLVCDVKDGVDDNNKQGGYVYGWTACPCCYRMAHLDEYGENRDFVYGDRHKRSLKVDDS